MSSNPVAGRKRKEISVPSEKRLELFYTIREDRHVDSSSNTLQCGVNVVGNARSLKRTHASPSLIVDGKYGDSEVIIKISQIRPESVQNNSLTNEIDIYENVANPLIIQRKTPHIMLCLASWKCRLEKVAEPLKTLITNSFDFEKEPSTHLQFLVMEKGSGQMLHSFLWDNRASLTDNDILCILFQLVWTLKCFESVQLQHNDLSNISNVWIDVLPTPRTFIYQAFGNNVVWRVTTKFMVKIFDFDRATAPKYANTLLDKWPCTNFGQCNTFTNCFDAFAMLTIMRDHCQNSAMRDDVRKIGVLLHNWMVNTFGPNLMKLTMRKSVGKEAALGLFAHYPIPCLCTKVESKRIQMGQTNVCVQCKITDDLSRAKMIHVLLYDKFFQQFRIKSSAVDSVAADEVFTLPM